MTEFKDAVQQSGKSEFSWVSVSPVPGRRTKDFLTNEPRFGRLKPVVILEHLTPNSDIGVLLFPGGLDRITDEGTLMLGAERGMSVFHIKYPQDSSFSIRREVVQALDHTEQRGMRKYHLVAGSWGGIPALNAAYRLLQEGEVKIESIFLVAAALQPSDLVGMVRVFGKTVAPAVLRFGVALPGRQTLARVSGGVSDFEYTESGVLSGLKKTPTVLCVPPQGRDWWVDARSHYKEYLPNAWIIEYPAYANWREKLSTMGGHDSSKAISGIRQIEGSFFDNPLQKPILPEGFKYLQYKT